MYKALDIAFWLIAKNNIDQKDCDPEEFEGITNMKIQKLLYFAQGISFALYGKKLFNEQILAWEYGPAIREVYTEFIKFKSGFIYLYQVSSFDSESIASIEKDAVTREILNDVYDCLNKFSASQLRNISLDKNGPWARIYKPGVKTNVIELDDYLVNYFQTHFEVS